MMSSPSLAAGQKPYTPRAFSSRLSTILSSSLRASSNSFCAVAPTFGSSKIFGILALQLPGHEERRPVDVAARVRRAGSRAVTRRPRNAGLSMSHGRPIGRRTCSRTASAYGDQLRLAAARCTRGPARLALRDSRRRSRRSIAGSAAARRRRRTARRRARGPSLLSYCGAIFTAVCLALVVAPPISSGRSNPCRCISRATWTISSRLGVISPLRPMMFDAFGRGPSPESSRTAPSRPGR